MFDFSGQPSQIAIPSLYAPPSKVWSDENADPSIAAVVHAYVSSHPSAPTRHRRQRATSLSIGVAHPPVKPALYSARLPSAPAPTSTPSSTSTSASAARPPLSIRIPNVAPLAPIHRRIFNTSRPAPPPRNSAPTLQALSDWVAASQRRARDSREHRSKIIAARLLALHSPKPLRFRLPPSEYPRPYVKSSLSQSISLDP